MDEERAVGGNGLTQAGEGVFLQRIGQVCTLRFIFSPISLPNSTTRAESPATRKRGSGYILQLYIFFQMWRCLVHFPKTNLDFWAWF